MPNVKRRAVPVLVSAVLLTATINVGVYATSGGPLILGKGNKAARTTKLRTTGTRPALRLRSKPGVPGLAVSNNALVRS